MSAKQLNGRSSWASTVVVALLSALVGGIVVWIGQTGSFRLRPLDMSYADLAATLLASVGVIVTVVSVVLALAAFWGYNQLKKEAVVAAEDVAKAEIKEQIENGSLRIYTKELIDRQMQEETSYDRLQSLINERVDSVLFGRPSDDNALEELDIIEDDQGQS